jgi:hypothetical protein
MNLTAKTGLSVWSGAAFLMLDFLRQPVRRARRASVRTSIMYHAYAPEPIVLDTSLNGTCVGNGASCECGIEAVMIATPESYAFKAKQTLFFSST